jgi:glycosyltransferase involved in cell wall biosynthesis
VLGFFGSPGAGKQFDWVLAAWRKARRAEPATALGVVGGRPEIDLAPDERPWFRPLGYLDLRQASEALQAFDVLGLPFVDGVSERRSSFMAGLAHGLAVVTTLGEATGTELRSSDAFEGASGGRDDYADRVAALLADPDRRQNLARHARRHYATRYDWPCLAATLRQRLDGPAHGP